MKKQYLLNIFRNLFLSFVVALGLLSIIATSGGGGGDGSPAVDAQEAELVESAYLIFYEQYIFPGSVREPFSGETLKYYVNSYRSTNDIYTKYYNESEMLNIYETFSTPENLVVRTYSPSILYIAFEKFVADTAFRVTEAVKSHINMGYDKLILDLRVNSGGSPGEALTLLDYFTNSQPSNSFLCGIYGPAISNEYYSGDYKYGNENTFNDTNMYILTSGYTASASEILIAGLLDFNESIQLGSTTFGKSRIVRFFTSYRGDGFEITVGHVYHSDGIDREGIGLVPESGNSTNDPFNVAMNRFGGSAPDPLREDWSISEIAYSNLYSQDYWRDRAFYAAMFQSLSVLKLIE